MRVPAIMVIGMLSGMIAVAPPGASGQAPPPSSQETPSTQEAPPPDDEEARRRRMLKSGAEEQPKREPETKLVPMLAVSERYDSNVFFVPGGNLEDYVTRAVPELRIEHRGRYIEGNLQGGATAEQYVKNPGLSWIGGQGAVDLTMDRLVKRFVSQRAGLHIDDYFRYTPMPPAFMAPTTGNVASQAFVEGIQTARANSYFNIGNIRGTYAFTPSTSLVASYKNQDMRFGRRIANQQIAQAARFFNTMFQIAEVGPQVTLSPRDTVNANYQYQRADFSNGGFGSGFETQGGMVGWERVLTPTLKGRIAGGAAVVSRGNSLQYQGNAKLEYTGQTTDAEVQYLRAVRPSFYLGGLPLLNQLVSATVTHHLTERLSVVGYGAYAQNESVPDPILRYTSYVGRGALDYQITQWLTAILSYSFSHYDYSLGGASQFGTLASRQINWDRHVAMITLRAEWR